MPPKTTGAALPRATRHSRDLIVKIAKAQAVIKSFGYVLR